MKGKIPLRLEGMSQVVDPLDAAIGQWSVFFTLSWSFARVGSIFDAILLKRWRQTCRQRRGEVAERLKAAVC
jgi:hypothetical protein